MFKKIEITFFLSLFIVLFFLTLKFYFSEKNIKFINKSRNSYEFELYNLKVPLLKNDTDNIITFNNDVENFKKKTKKRFWEKLISGKDE